MNPFDPEGFWNKAVLFVNRATEPTGYRTIDEARLWASLSLEQAAKWALADISPALVADPVNDGGNQLLHALNLKETSRPVTASASTVFQRCADILKPFDFKEATRIAADRDDYLHGAGIGIVISPDETWWPRYWSLMHILLTSRQRSFEDLVDHARVSLIEHELERNKRRIANEYEALEAAAATRLRRIKAGSLSAVEMENLRRHSWGIPNARYIADAVCPVCGSSGSVGSEDEVDRKLIWDAEDPVVEVTFYPDSFYCGQCHFTLDRFELVEVSNLNEEFLTIEEPGPYDFAEYGND